MTLDRLAQVAAVLIGIGILILVGELLTTLFLVMLR
jgi:hypothetical protein